MLHKNNIENKEGSLHYFKILIIGFIIKINLCLELRNKIFYFIFLFILLKKYSGIFSQGNIISYHFVYQLLFLSLRQKYMKNQISSRVDYLYQLTVLEDSVNQVEKLHSSLKTAACFQIFSSTFIFVFSKFNFFYHSSFKFC